MPEQQRRRRATTPRGAEAEQVRAEAERAERTRASRASRRAGASSGAAARLLGRLEHLLR